MNIAFLKSISKRNFILMKLREAWQVTIHGLAKN